LYKWDCDNNGDVLVVKVGWVLKADRSASGVVLETGIDDGTDRPRMAITVFGNQQGYKL
jgi:type IV pilus assembly protein PilV